MKLAPRVERAALQASANIRELVETAIRFGADRKEAARLVEKFLSDAEASGLHPAIISAWRSELDRAIKDATAAASTSLARH